MNHKSARNSRAPTFSFGYASKKIRIGNLPVTHAGHVVTFATSGAGEVALTANNIIDYEGSSVVLDTTGRGDLYSATAVALLAKGNRVIVIDPDAVLDVRGIDFNLLDFVIPSQPYAFQAATRMAEMMVVADGGEYLAQHVKIVQSIIALAVYHVAGLHEEARSMSGLRDLFKGGCEAIERAVRAVADTAQLTSVVSSALRVLEALSGTDRAILCRLAEGQTKFIDFFESDLDKGTYSAPGDHQTLSPASAPAPKTFTPEIFNGVRTTVFIVGGDWEKKLCVRRYRALVGLMLHAASSAKVSVQPVGFFLHGALQLGEVTPLAEAICSGTATKTAIWLGGQIELPRLQLCYPEHWERILASSALLLLHTDEKETFDYFHPHLKSPVMVGGGGSSGAHYSVIRYNPIAVMPGVKTRPVHALNALYAGARASHVPWFRNLLRLGRKPTQCADRSREHLMRSTVCAKCGEPLGLSTQAILVAEYRCTCGVLYKVITGVSDVSQVKKLDNDPQALLGNHSMKIVFRAERKG